MLDMEQTVEELVAWLKESMKEAHCKGMLVGISGGIDSALVAFLIKKACPDASLGIILPILNQEEDLIDARQVIDASGIRDMTIDLTSMHRDLLATVQMQLKTEGLWKDGFARMTDANLRARLRMATLYAVANNLGYLVVGTDNAAEYYTGYFTKYGDGGVDILPIANLNKGEVKELARYVGVPESVLTKKPSAGLWEGQTDEEEMGISYAVIDAFLAGEPVSDAEKKKLEHMHRVTEHKRKTPPKPESASHR